MKRYVSVQCIPTFRFSTSPATSEGEIAYRVVPATVTVCDLMGHDFKQVINSKRQDEILFLLGYNHENNMICPICGERMVDPHPNSECGVIHLLGSHCSWHDPVCPNESNHGVEVCARCGKHRRKVTKGEWVEEP